MYRAPRTSLAILLPLALLIAIPTLGACATTSSPGAQSEQSAEEPTKKRRRFYDPWGQPYEENTPEDSPPPVEYEESDEL
ncbi:hypothetical protein FRC98_13445 [Lujinxingia vulgaris]|uniref:Secreted protein n=1 Tax=Lujinxingia vulgaris TaxID=2600176 RepID=A0A5C6XDE2_9DELT|nr:hypothetical protein [Lujinxingia vulgaris]TXD36122.1 hypothetical protein FRC98_13445 [Lujinxingia vulgaris]